MSQPVQVTDQASTKRERLEVRVTAEQKELIQHAAALQGRSISDFVTESVQRAAEAIIREQAVITLTARDSLAFSEAILKPLLPGDGLRSATRRYLREVEER